MIRLNFYLIGALAVLALTTALWATPPGLLAQANPAAATLTDIYTVPATARISVEITTVTVANRDVAQHTFRLSMAPLGAADNLAQYLYYDITIPPKSTLVQSVSLPLVPGDVIRAYADAQQLSFSLFGQITP